MTEAELLVLPTQTLIELALPKVLNENRGPASDLYRY